MFNQPRERCRHVVNERGAAQTKEMINMISEAALPLFYINKNNKTAKICIIP